MQSLKNLMKRSLGLHPKSSVTPLADINYIGSGLHGYYIPENYLTPNSVCYLVGTGEDISIDTELVIKYDCNVYVIDPAPEGINHFNLLNRKTLNGETLSIGHEKGAFTYRIKPEQLMKMKYLSVGLWDQDTLIRFYKPANDKYVSHSIELFKETGEYIEVPVDRLSNIMKKNGHTSIDLLKLEIEGAEYKVLETIVEDKLDVKMIAVEYDEVYHCKGFDYLYRIKKSTDNLLNNGYKLAHSTDYFKRLFIQEDLFAKLQGRQEAAAKIQRTIEEELELHP
jgi:FkbM family methyltransferase